MQELLFLSFLLLYVRFFNAQSCSCSNCITISPFLVERWEMSPQCNIGERLMLHNMTFTTLDNTRIGVLTLTTNDYSYLVGGYEYEYFTYFSTPNATTCFIPKRYSNLTLTVPNLYVVAFCYNVSCSISYKLTMKCIPDTCTRWTNCSSCTNDMGCVWCTGLNQCVEGDPKYGPTLGACAYLNQSSLCPRPPQQIVPTVTGISDGGIAGIVVGVLLLVIIIVCVILWIFFRDELYLRYGSGDYVSVELPREITDIYEICKHVGIGEEGMAIKEFEPESTDCQQVFDMYKKHLGGEDLELECIICIFRKESYQSFAANFANVTRRLIHSPDVFKSESWKSDDQKGLRTWTTTCFAAFERNFSWNATLTQSKIVPMLHGTSREIAMKIFVSGFAATSTLDSGWYGNGMYFSSNACYTIPYFATKRDPAIILSFIITGNVYPVIEHPTGEHSLAGKTLKKGYQSYYVKTSKQGYPLDVPTPDNVFDELVVEQEGYILPVCILVPKYECVQKLLAEYQRNLPV